VVIDDLHVECITVLPAKADAPLIVDANASRYELTLAKQEPVREWHWRVPEPS
jgi:hypothetical protein